MSTIKENRSRYKKKCPRLAKPNLCEPAGEQTLMDKKRASPQASELLNFIPERSEGNLIPWTEISCFEAKNCLANRSLRRLNLSAELWIIFYRYNRIHSSANQLSVKVQCVISSCSTSIQCGLVYLRFLISSRLFSDCFLTFGTVSWLFPDCFLIVFWSFSGLFYLFSYYFLHHSNG